MKARLITIVLVCMLVFTACSNGKSKNVDIKNDEYTVKVEEKQKPPFKEKGQGVPVLMYHSIACEEGNPVRVPEEKFKEQMKYLKDNGYTTLTLSELYDYLMKDTPIPEKSLVLTFDDGYVDNYKSAYPILKEYGFKGTVFVITSLIDKDDSYLTSEQIKEMQENGMDIESHTVNHEHLKDLNYEEQLSTLKDSKEFLENILNKEVRYIAYPYGEYNEDTLKAVKDAGYIMGFTTDGRWSDKTDGILTLDRVYISGFFELDVFKDRISNPEYEIEN